MYKPPTERADEVIFGRGPSLRRRIIYTLLLLIAFRILAATPVLNADEAQMNKLLADNPLIGLLDLLAGGEVLKKFSLAAVGLIPYLTALGLTNLVIWYVSRRRGLEADDLQKKKIEKYVGWLTIPFSFIFAFLLCGLLSLQGALFPAAMHWFTRATFFTTLKIVALVTLGSLVSALIVKLITKKGLADGKDLVLLAGSSFAFLTQLFTIARQSPSVRSAVLRIAVVIGIAFAVIIYSRYLLRAQRRIEIASPKTKPTPDPRSRQRSYLPLLLSSAGVTPIAVGIGLLGLLQLMQSVTQSIGNPKLMAFTTVATRWATPERFWYWLAVSIVIVFYTYLFNFHLLRPYKESEISLSEQLKRNNQYLPGIKPGQETQKFLERVMWRNTVEGALGLVLLGAVLPFVILRLTGQNLVATLLSLIVVVVTVDNLTDKFKARDRMLNYEGYFPGRNKRLRKT